jgi:urease accessory protein
MRATTIIRHQAVNASFVLDTAHLTYADRQMLEGKITTEKGRIVNYTLDKKTLLNHGDALKLEDGQLILIKAAPEHLVRIEAENPTRLLRAALHMGDHHIATEIAPDALYIQPDAHAEDTLRGLGCRLTHVNQAFTPEAVHDHCHHDHGHGHAHDHTHDHGKEHDKHGCCGHHH